MIVEIRAPDLALVPHWNTLVSRTDANVFMHPAALVAAAADGFTKIEMLLAWDGDRLVGLWALRSAAASDCCRLFSRRRPTNIRSSGRRWSIPMNRTYCRRSSTRSRATADCRT